MNSSLNPCQLAYLQLIGRRSTALIADKLLKHRCAQGYVTINRLFISLAKFCVLRFMELSADMSTDVRIYVCVCILMTVYQLKYLHNLFIFFFMFQNCAFILLYAEYPHSFMCMYLRLPFYISNLIDIAYLRSLIFHYLQKTYLKNLHMNMYCQETA